MLLAAIETLENRLPRPVITLGRVPLFFYVVHLYLIHALALLFLVCEGRQASEYILSASGIRSGTLSDFGLGLGGVYLVWSLVILLLYPVCRWYQRYRENHPSHGWLRYL